MRPTDIAAIHNDAFTRDAVSIAVTSSMIRRQVASDLWVGLSTSDEWVKMVSAKAGPPDPVQNLLRADELLRRQWRIVKVYSEQPNNSVHRFPRRANRTKDEAPD